MVIRSLLAATFIGWLMLASSVAGAASALRLLVLESSPPMSYRDADGRLTGFTIEIARALCAEMGEQCEMEVTRLDQVLDLLAAAERLLAATGDAVTFCPRYGTPAQP